MGKRGWRFEIGDGDGSILAMNKEGWFDEWMMDHFINCS
jgi:hypothetical protein